MCIVNLISTFWCSLRNSRSGEDWREEVGGGGTVLKELSKYSHQGPQMSNDIILSIYCSNHILFIYCYTYINKNDHTSSLG